MERERTKVIRRLATAGYRCTAMNNKLQPTDADLHGSFEWHRAEAIYRELIKIDEESTNETHVSRNR